MLFFSLLCSPCPFPAQFFLVATCHPPPLTGSVTSPSFILTNTGRSHPALGLIYMGILSPQMQADSNTLCTLGSVTAILVCCWPFQSLIDFLAFNAFLTCTFKFSLLAHFWCCKYSFVLFVHFGLFLHFCSVNSLSTCYCKFGLLSHFCFSCFILVFSLMCNFFYLFSQKDQIRHWLTVGCYFFCIFLWFRVI